MFARVLVLGLVLLAAVAAPALSLAEPPQPQYGPFYSGQLLVARPAMGDPRFSEAVIYLADHDAKGAFGLVVNQLVGRGPLKDFMAGLKMAPADDVTGDVALYAGGPVERGAGFVLHTADYATEGTAMRRGGFSVTASLKAIRDIAQGKGPRRYRVLLGYAGWGPGQLENELRRGDWDIAPADEAILFDDDTGSKWARARAAVGLPM